MNTNIYRLPRTLLRMLCAATVVLLALILLALGDSPAEAATTFTVNKTGDAGDTTINGVCDTSRTTGSQCTLRAAIQEANATPNSGGPDEIDFAIGGTATVKTISPTRPLPAITEAVTIDGYTQGSQTADTSDDAKPNDNLSFSQGTNAVIKVQLKGTDAGATANGLRVTSSESTIKGLAINRFAQNGILIKGSGATGNVVEGNFIGTNASGTRALPNLGNGVRISGAPENTIGGTEPAQRNLISGNGSDGVEIRGSEATLNEVEGNYIGADASRTEDLGNASDGVLIAGAPNNTIGGSSFPFAGNWISSNDSDGVAITGPGATGNKVGANRIPGNSGHGVHVEGASDNTIGGDDSATLAGNSIDGNGGDGVFVASGTGNSIFGGVNTSIDGNGGLAIDLGADGVTANDEDDTDTGANDLQNFPVLTALNCDLSNSFVDGTLNSAPNQTFTLQFFWVTSGADGSGHGEGEVYDGQAEVTTDDEGNAAFRLDIQSCLGAPATLTATATNKSTGDTSEFSANVMDI